MLSRAKPLPQMGSSAGCAKFEAGATSGTAGTWYTYSAVAVGATPSGSGFFCPTAGGVCSAATEVGHFYLSSTVAANQVASTTGVLCPSTNQGTSPPNTCSAVATGATATYLGTACRGDTAACGAVVNGYTAPTNGVNCGGCAYKNSGETANVAGKWWTVADIASGATASSAGIFCPSSGACSNIASGATASTAGVLCPTDLATGNTVAGSSSTTAAIVTTSQGSAFGASNSAFKAATTSLFAVITALFFMMALK